MQNISQEKRTELRVRAKKIVELDSIGWSLRNIGKTVGISHAMVAKTLDQVEAAKEGSLYFAL